MRAFVFICFVGLAFETSAQYTYSKGQQLPAVVTTNSNLQLQLFTPTALAKHLLPSPSPQTFFKTQPQFFPSSVPATQPLTSSVPSTAPTLYFAPQFSASTFSTTPKPGPYNRANLIAPNLFNTNANFEAHVQQNTASLTPQTQSQKSFKQQTNTNSYQKYSSAAQETVVSKHFYIHSAPEEPEEEVQEQEVNLGPARKNYRVVFIRAPVPAEHKAALKIAQPQNEEKTAIYVLTKKTDPTEIRTALETTPANPTKPEVYFIKYKTFEEAVHAQQQIQAQYDALGGTSEVTDEGYAPVSSVIGSLGTNEAHAASTKLNQSGQSAAQNPYLPPFGHPHLNCENSCY